VTDANLIWQAGVEVVEHLRAAGHQAWLVGGCVRDRLLGRPLKDADVATSAEPDEVERLFPRTVAVGKAFGVIKVILDRRPATGDQPQADLGSARDIEVATLRADDRYIDGRRPVAVRRGTLQEDAERRDLTVNALYADPHGGITDPVGGLPDLQARLLRGIGDPAARLAEDRLRVLRVLRFAAVLGFAIEPATAAAVRTTAITGVSRERVLDELGKAAAAGAAGGFLELCHVHGQLAAVAPCPDPGRSAAILARLGPAPLGSVLAGWLLGLSTDAIDAWISMQPVPSAVRRNLAWLVTTAPALAGFGLVERRRALRHPEAERLVALASAITPERTRDYVAWLGQEADAGAMPLAAGDLIAAGMAPGPGLGAALHRAEDAWLAGSATDRRSLLAIALAAG